MQRIKKKTISFLLAAIVAPSILLMVGIYLSSDTSFDIDKIRPTSNFSLQPSKTDSDAEIERLRVIISQPFSYLAEGNDSYVFVSQDQRYVIKFFKMRRMTPKYWLNYIPIPCLDTKRLSKISERERARLETFGSLKTAYEKFRYQTALVFLHLFKTEYLKMKVCVIDADGLAHRVPLDKVPFVIQKKTTMLPDYIKMLVSQGKESEAVQSLCKVLALVKDQCQNGLADYGERVEEEYGFIEGRPIHVGGGCVLDETYKSARSTLREVFRVSKSIEAWLQHSNPSLMPSFQDEVEDLLSFLERN